MVDRPSRASAALGGRASELTADLRGVEVSDVVARLRGEDAFRTDGRNAETVTHDGSTRVVISVVEPGREIGAPTNDGHVTLIVLEGEGSLSRADESIPVRSGTLAILAPGAGWSLTPSTSLACVASFWQPGASDESGEGLPRGAAEAP